VSRLLATVDVPASSANLGSGFDCFAVALSLKLRAELRVGDEPGISLHARGEGADAAERDGPDNLVARSFREALRLAHGSGHGSGSWRIELSSMIPSARGLGSSAAAIVAGVLLGASVGRRAPEPEELLALAARLEGHADNVSATMRGGFTLAVPDETDGPIRLRRFRVPEAWIPVVFVPQAESSTAEMRDVLPLAVPHHEAVLAAGRAALLATAIMSSDASLLRTAMDDRLHQPFRLPRMPGAARLIELAYERGAAGAALSGAGPAVLAICDSPPLAHSVEKAFATSGIGGMAMRLRFDTSGARVQRADED
jgi:homoserine kinase